MTEQKTKFTPGPWYKRGKKVFWTKPEKDLPQDNLLNGCVCICATTEDEPPEVIEEAKANAELIAAAPSFYEDEEKKLAYLKILKGNILSIENELRCGKWTLDMEMTLKYAVQSIDIIIRETEELLAEARMEARRKNGR